jgi:hypothetical protein
MKKFYLLIETNQYAGNFGRELCSYVFGAYYNTQEWVEDLRKLFDTEVGEDHVLTDNLHQFYDEYGETVCEIYNEKCLKVFFDEDPTPHMDIIQERLKKFPDVLATSWKFAVKNLKIKRVTLFQEVTKEETIWVKSL